MIQFEYSAFEEATVPICTFVLKNSYVDKKGCYLRLTEFRGGMEIQRQKTLEAISNYKCGFYYEQNVKQFFKIPGSPVAYWVSDNVYKCFEDGLLGQYAITKQGFKTGDNNRFLRLWYEVDFSKTSFNGEKTKKWFPCTKGGEYRKWYGNFEYIVNWENDGFEIKHFVDDNGKLRSRPQNLQVNFTKEITWSSISSANISFRLADETFMYESKGPVLTPKVGYSFMLAYLNSKVYQQFIKIVAPTLDYSEGAVLRVPYANISELQELGLADICVGISKKDWDSFETSWDFQYHPLIYKTSTIAEAFEQWQIECDNRFNQLKTNEEELNRIFINIYGLQDELTSEVEEKDIAVRKADLCREIRSFISYAVGCMFGRYSLDKESLVYAGGDFNEYYSRSEKALIIDEKVLQIGEEPRAVTINIGYDKINVNGEWRNVSFAPDSDNCIPITDEEYFSDDIVTRFVEFVKTVYGADTLEENLDFIANALGNKGDTSREVIRNYFLKDFYADHLKIYQKRPIYWLFDSGKQNGFKALIYMHRYDADTVGRVRTDYLHRAQKYVETAMQSAQYTIDNAASASEKSKATKAVTKYTKQLAEMKIYDEAIAHIANKRIEIDLDDGVKVNYAKFQGVEVAQEGKKALKVDLLAKLK